MASREFLKILSSARLGDVLAQQKLAQAYLTGAFKTPIQPSNALIWLEKSFLSAQNQAQQDNSSDHPASEDLLNLVADIPLAETLHSPAFQFGWESFWKLAEMQSESSATSAAQWQLANLLINPSNQELQSQLMEWVNKKFNHYQDKTLMACKR
jgi:TPR repeat protein